MNLRNVWRPSRLVLLLLVLTWPLTFLYTSIGFDQEWAEGPVVRERYWRIRWPGNGSVMGGWIEEHHKPGNKPIESFDVGAAVLRRGAGWPRTPTVWNKLGFWWIDYTKGDPLTALPPHVDRARLVGIPHWLLILPAFVACLAQWSGRREQS